jgi:hypothetical protein
VQAFTFLSFPLKIDGSTKCQISENFLAMASHHFTKVKELQPLSFFFMKFRFYFTFRTSSFSDTARAAPKQKVVIPISVANEFLH